MKNNVEMHFCIELERSGEKTALFYASAREQSLFVLSYDQEFLLESFNEVRNYFSETQGVAVLDSISNYTGPYRSDSLGSKFVGYNANVLAAIFTPLMVLIKTAPQRFSNLLEETVPDDLLFMFLLDKTLILIYKNADESIKVQIIHSQKQFLEDTLADVFEKNIGMREAVLMEISHRLPPSSEIGSTLVTGLIAQLLCCAHLLQITGGVIEAHKEAQEITIPKYPWANNAQNN